MIDDRGRWVSGMVLRRHLTAMPCSLYEIRLIHSGSRRPYPGVRRWTASQLLDPATVGFLRIRNREDYDVYFRPYAGDHNAGYILVDLDHPAPGVLASLRAQGHEPSVVVESSPGRLQAWIRVSAQPLSPALATRISRHLAHLYAADRASADWRHVGRLAGFANRKLQRRQSDGLAPWVKLIDARGCLASRGAALIECAVAELAAGAPVTGRRSEIQRDAAGWPQPLQTEDQRWVPNTADDSNALRSLYPACLQRLRIFHYFPDPDWSIADKWVARELLQRGTPVAIVADVLRLGSPGLPRGHADPEDYLHRTLRCAAR